MGVLENSIRTGESQIVCGKSLSLQDAKKANSVMKAILPGVSVPNEVAMFYAIIGVEQDDPRWAISNSEFLNRLRIPIDDLYNEIFGLVNPEIKITNVGEPRVVFPVNSYMPGIVEDAVNKGNFIKGVHDGEKFIPNEEPKVEKEKPQFYIPGWYKQKVTLIEDNPAIKKSLDLTTELWNTFMPFLSGDALIEFKDAIHQVQHLIYSRVGHGVISRKEMGKELIDGFKEDYQNFKDQVMGSFKTEEIEKEALSKLWDKVCPTINPGTESIGVEMSLQFKQGMITKLTAGEIALYVDWSEERDIKDYQTLLAQAILDKAFPKNKTYPFPEGSYKYFYSKGKSNDYYINSNQVKGEWVVCTLKDFYEEVTDRDIKPKVNFMVGGNEPEIKLKLKKKLLQDFAMGRTVVFAQELNPCHILSGKEPEMLSMLLESANQLVEHSEFLKGYYWVEENKLHYSKEEIPFNGLGISRLDEFFTHTREDDSL